MLRIRHYFPIIIIALLVAARPLHAIDYKLKTVIIDAGHGGKDPGAVNGTTKEKDIVLRVALKTGELIKQRHPELKVIYTRSTDTFVNLSERADIANKHNADLFISIHVNAHKDPIASGSETFVMGLNRSKENLEVAKLENSVILLEDDYNTRYEGFDPTQPESYIMFELIQNEYLEQSRQFAEKVQTQFVTHAKRQSRGVKQDIFLVLRRTTMPSVLVELGFLSNPDEKAFMTTTAGMNTYAASIANAFFEYKKSIEDKSLAIIDSSQTDTLVQKIASINPDIENKDTNTFCTEIASPKTETQNPKTEPLKKQPAAETPKSMDTIQEIVVLKGTWFGIQILASAVKLNLNDPKLKNQKNVFYLFENNSHKYFVALNRNNEASRQNLANVKKLYPDAFPVAFSNGKKVDLKSELSKINPK